MRQGERMARGRREEGVAEWRQRERESRRRGGESVVCAIERERRNQMEKESNAWVNSSC